MAEYNVFGSGAPPYTTAAYNDGGPSIKLGNFFYLTNATGDKISWRCTGGRVYIPNDPLVTNKSITISARLGTDQFSFDMDNPPTQSKITTTPAGGGWVEVHWDDPFIIDYGPLYCFVFIAYQFNGASEDDCYIAAPSPGSAAVPSVSIGAGLVLAESPTPGNAAVRARYQIGGSGAGNGSHLWYGADIIVDDGAPSPPDPEAEYGFNHYSGTSVADSSGNGHDLTVASSSNFAAGHVSKGVFQTAALTYAINNSAPWIDPEVNPQFTVMFWGKRDSEGSDTDGWTVRQDLTGSGMAWGIMQSDGTDTLFRFFISGFVIYQTAPKQPVGEWHHYTLVTNGYWLRSYIDGVLNSEGGANGIVGGGSGTSAQNILVYGGNAQQQTIDDLRFFEYPLSPAHIQYYMDLDVNYGYRSGKVKVWNGSSWSAHPLKVWNGSSWEVKPMNGSADGSTFTLGKDI